jgi:hypothetical protein
MQMAVKLTLILNCIYLILLIVLLNFLHSHILLPICSIRGLSGTQFCNATRLAAAVTPLSTSSDRILCWLSGASSHPLCETSNASSTRLTKAICDEFHRLLALYRSASDMLQIVTDISDAIYTINDLIILVRNSDIKNGAAIVETLKYITAAGKRSSYALNKYAAHVSATVKLCVVYFYLYKYQTLT